MQSVVTRTWIPTDQSRPIALTRAMNHWALNQKNSRTILKNTYLNLISLFLRMSHFWRRCMNSTHSISEAPGRGPCLRSANTNEQNTLVAGYISRGRYMVMSSAPQVLLYTIFRVMVGSDQAQPFSKLFHHQLTAPNYKFLLFIQLID